MDAIFPWMPREPNLNFLTHGAPLSALRARVSFALHSAVDYMRSPIVIQQHPLQMAESCTGTSIKHNGNLLAMALILKKAEDL